MKENDIVRIITQPPNQMVDLVDEVGFIEEINNGTAVIQALNIDGSLSGCGAIPLECLAVESDSKWQEAYNLYQKKFAQNISIGETNQKDIDNLLNEVGKKYNLTGDQIWKIYSEVKEKKEQILKLYIL